MNRADPYCKCEDRISVAGIVTYCPWCRDRRTTRIVVAISVGLILAGAMLLGVLL